MAAHIARRAEETKSEQCHNKVRSNS